MADLPLVTQELRYLASGPPMIGWMVQIFLSGACFSTAAHQIFDNPHHSKRTKYLAGLVTFLNTCVLGITVAEVLYWSTLQNPSYDQIWAFIVPDAIVTIPAGLLAAVVQSIFAHRAYKVVHENKLFLVIISLLILAALGGALAVASVSLTYTLDPAQYTFEKTMWTVQIWLSASAFVDMLITAVLLASLYKYRMGYGKSLNSTYTWFMNLAFQTASVTACFAVTGCILCACTWNANSGSIYFAFVYPLPSLYAYSYLFMLDSTAKAKRRRSNLPDATTPRIQAAVDVVVLPQLSKMEIDTGRYTKSASSHVVEFPGCVKLPEGML